MNNIEGLIRVYDSNPYFCKGGSLTEDFDEIYVAFLILESLYASGVINLNTYQNVLKKKNQYIQKKMKEKNKTMPQDVA